MVSAMACSRVIGFPAKVSVPEVHGVQTNNNIKKEHLLQTGFAGAQVFYGQVIPVCQADNPGDHPAGLFRVQMKDLIFFTNLGYGRQ